MQQFKKHESEDKYTIKQSYKYVGDGHWKWSVWIDWSDSGLDKIDNVVYTLHYTFRNPVRVVTTRANKFELKTSGWGIFTIYIRLNFKDQTVLDLEHDLELLYTNGEQN